MAPLSGNRRILDATGLVFMSDTFNGYHVWLGIPANEQPPNHYRLLGIADFEKDLDVIEHAADRQMAHVRTFQSGRQGPLSQQILNELALARLCLLHPEKKAAYDQELRAKQPASPNVASPVKAQPIAVAKPMPIGRAVPTGQAFPAGSAVPTGQAMPVAKPVSPLVPRASTNSQPRASSIEKPAAAKPSNDISNISVDEIGLELGNGAAPSFSDGGMRIRVRRRRYNQNSNWKSAAILGTLCGIAVIGALLLYSFLSKLDWEEMLKSPALPNSTESGVKVDQPKAPNAPSPAAPHAPAAAP